MADENGNRIPIDFKKVDQLLIAGCTGREIAGQLGFHEDTLYNRIKEEFGIGFSAYSAAKYSTGDGMIKAKRFGKAMEGNVQILLYLSDKRLKEENKNDAAHTQELIDLKLENARLITENYKLKNANQSETSSEHNRS